MATSKQAEKRMRQNAKRNAANRTVRSTMRTQIKKVRAAVEANDAETARAELPKAVSQIANASRKGAIHHRTAARYTSRITRLVNSLEAQG